MLSLLHLIDNIIINKTATPELTGEFAGGLVQMNTKDVPAKDFLSCWISALDLIPNQYLKILSAMKGITQTGWVLMMETGVCPKDFLQRTGLSGIGGTTSGYSSK